MSTIASLETTPAESWKDLVVNLLPSQGEWSEEAYLWLTDQTSRLVELNDGHLEVLPVPTDRHQSILQALFLEFYQYVHPRGGKVQFAPLRLRICAGKVREPDLLLVKDAADPRRQDRFWTGADLALEVLSPDRPERDREEKRVEYAAAGVPEYWIVDPVAETIEVLKLLDGSYQSIGVFARDATVVSDVLPGFSFPTIVAFDAK